MEPNSGETTEKDSAPSYQVFFFYFLLFPLICTSLCHIITSWVKAEAVISENFHSSKVYTTFTHSANIFWESNVCLAIMKSNMASVPGEHTVSLGRKILTKYKYVHITQEKSRAQSMESWKAFLRKRYVKWSLNDVRWKVERKSIPARRTACVKAWERNRQKISMAEV